MILRLFLCFLVTGWAQAQVPSDSLTNYELGEIVVSSGGSTPSRISPSTVQRVSLAGIAQLDAASIDHVLRRIPSAHIQTNSRGESLVYLRGAGERQVSLFFDGALLNIPWDNRVDLGLIPSEVVGDITVAKGVPSVLYGPNVLGGAINMTSRELRNRGSFTQLSGITGSYGTSQARFTWLRHGKGFRSTVFGGISNRDGMGVPGSAALPFSQTESTLRTNTDRRMRSFFAQGAYHGEGDLSIGLALLRFDGSKGVAPEGHLDPKVSRVRFWRYPKWETNMAILSSQLPLKRGRLRGALWYSRFGQAIDQYTDHTYRTLVETQEDQDDTYGMRLTVLQELHSSGTLRGALSILTSRHLQHNLQDNIASPSLSFLQRIYSGGVEYIWDGPVQLMAGTSWDVLTTPETGDKPARDAQDAFGVTAGAVYPMRSGITIRATAGRKTRFPTMRELFGEALGRFLVNRDLKPESSFLSEVALHIEKESTSGEAIFFMNRTYDTIGQRMVESPNGSRALRQRINLEGSRVYGVELTFSSRLARGLRANWNMTWMEARGVENGQTVPLVEKPSWLGGGSLQYNTRRGLSIMAESIITGHAYGLADDNTHVGLPGSVIINTRISWLFLYRRYAMEMFARVNNMTDDLTLPQLGLPGPGREFHAGLEVSL